MHDSSWEEITSSFELWDDHITHLRKDRDIPGLWPPQTNALQEGALQDNNFLMVSQPGTGKTLIAEIIAVNEWLSSGEPSVYLVPLVALAEEKYNEFEKYLGEFGLRINKAVDTDDPNPEHLFESDIIVMTYEKFDYYLRNYREIVSKINCAIIDEFHTVSNATRGPNLEVAVTELIKNHPEVRIVGLSATIPNPADVCDWLGGQFSFTPDWRHNELHEGICFGKEDEIDFYHDEKVIRTESVSRWRRRTKPNAIIDFLVSEAEKGEVGQTLVFSPTRRQTRQTATALANFIQEHERSHDFGLNRKAIDEIKDRIKEGPDSGQTESELLNCLSSGIGFHHAGLSQHAKSVLEEGLDKKHITTIVATSTLSAGVDLPIKRVFVLEPMLGKEKMAVSEYKNLVGRAGRPRIDEPGESVLFDDNRKRAKQKINTYINGDIESFHSRIDLSQHYGILLNLARQYPSVNKLLDFMNDTYLGYSGKISRAKLGDSVGEAVDDLDQWNMLEFSEGGELSLSDLGRAASKQLINPRTTHLAIKYLSETHDIDTFDFLTTLVSSPEFDKGLRLFTRRGDQWPDRDKIREDLELTHFNRSDFGNVITTARVIKDWICGDDLDEIYARHNVPTDYWGTADVRERIVPAFVRTLTSFLDILEESRSELYDEYGERIEILSKRIKHGLESESLRWVELDIERNRRRISDLQERVGIETPDEILDISTQNLANKVGNRRATRYRRRAIKKLLNGFERDKELITLDVREQDLNEESFSALLTSWEMEFQNCVIDHLKKIDSLRVDEVDEDKPGSHPEAYCYIYDGGGSYLTSLDGHGRFEIAIECKSRVNLKGEVSASSATEVLGKARDSTDAYVTVGTPSFSEGAFDAARENSILLLDSPSFSAAMIRLIQNEFDPERIQAFFSETGYLSRADVYGYSP